MAIKIIYKRSRLKQPFWMVFGFWMVRTIRNLNFQNGRSKLGCFISKKIIYIKQPSLKWPFLNFGFWMVRTIRKQNKKRFRFWMFGIQAPTVIGFYEIMGGDDLPYVNDDLFDVLLQDQTIYNCSKPIQSESVFTSPLCYNNKIDLNCSIAYLVLSFLRV